MHENARTGEPREGLRLTVYRAADLPDCTLGGITSKAANVTITMIRGTGAGRQPEEYPLPHDSQVHLPGPDDPEAILVIRHRPGGQRWLHLEPTGHPGCPYMADGNYADSCDSRWAAIAGTDLVAIHDRHER